MSCCSYEKYIESAGGTIVTVKTSFPVECHRVVFNVREDCDALHEATMKVVNIDTLIKILGHRTHEQRLQIVRQYKATFSKDLKDDLVSNIPSSNFMSTLKALVIDRAEYEAKCLYKAMKGIGTDESVLIEILATRSNAEISRIKDAYIKKYTKSLEEDLKGNSSGDFRRLLVSLCKGERDEGYSVDPDRASQDAEALIAAGEKKWGTDESVFNRILVSRSYPQLRLIFEEYKKKAHKDILATIRSEMTGDLEDGMVAIVKAVRNTPAFFAEKLYNSMKGIGTDNKGLTRIIVTRCELDMISIKREFEKFYKKSLSSFVRDDTSGKYCDILLALLHEQY